MKVLNIFALSALSATFAMAKSPKDKIGNKIQDLLEASILDKEKKIDMPDKSHDISPSSTTSTTSTASTNSDNITIIQNEDEMCIDGYYLETGEYCGEWAGATLRKLPLWGEQVSDDEINFEWPTQQQFDQMTPDAKIQSLDVKVARMRDSLGSVKVNLSNGESSPVYKIIKSQSLAKQHFQKSPVFEHPTNKDFIGFFNNGNITESKPINFDPNVSIRAVDSVNEFNFVYSLLFYDSSGQLQQVCDPLGFYQDQLAPERRHIIGDNEELIGVYGVMGLQDNLTSFGFIVKVKQEKSQELVATSIEDQTGDQHADVQEDDDDDSHSDSDHEDTDEDTDEDRIDQNQSTEVLKPASKPPKIKDQNMKKPKKPTEAEEEAEDEDEKREQEFYSRMNELMDQAPKWYNIYNMQKYFPYSHDDPNN